MDLDKMYVLMGRVRGWGYTQQSAQSKITSVEAHVIMC